MSYNIDSVECLVLNASMSSEDICNLLDEHEDELPESDFLREHEEQARAARRARNRCSVKKCNTLNQADAKFCKECGKKLSNVANVDVKLTNFWWSGEGSGHALPFLVEKVAPLIKGEVQAIFTWEGGDSHNGLAIKDGKVAQCEVSMTLDLPEGW